MLIVTARRFACDRNDPSHPHAERLACQNSTARGAKNDLMDFDWGYSGAKLTEIVGLHLHPVARPGTSYFCWDACGVVVVDSNHLTSVRIFASKNRPKPRMDIVPHIRMRIDIEVGCPDFCVMMCLLDSGRS